MLFHLAVSADGTPLSENMDTRFCLPSSLLPRLWIRVRSITGECWTNGNRFDGWLPDDQLLKCRQKESLTVKWISSSKARSHKTSPYWQGSKRARPVCYELLGDTKLRLPRRPEKATNTCSWQESTARRKCTAVVSIQPWQQRLLEARLASSVRLLYHAPSLLRKVGPANSGRNEEQE